MYIDCRTHLRWRVQTVQRRPNCHLPRYYAPAIPDPLTPSPVAVDFGGDFVHLRLETQRINPHRDHHLQGRKTEKTGEAGFASCSSTFQEGRKKTSWCCYCVEVSQSSSRLLSKEGLEENPTVEG